MSDRWRRPVRIKAVEATAKSVVRIGDRNYRDYDATMPGEDIARIRHGYVCVHCFEPHDVPFPAVCSLCGFRMRDDQMTVFAQTYGGEKWIGPRETLSDELERLREEDERKRHNPDSHIWLPRGVSH